MGMFDRPAAQLEQKARKTDDDRHEHGSPRPQDIVNGSPVYPAANSLHYPPDAYIAGMEAAGIPITVIAEAAEKVLDTLEAELDNEADADILADGPRPNEAMRWLIRLRELRANPLARSY